MFTRSRFGIAQILLLATLPLSLVACTETQDQLKAEAPAYINQVTEDGFRYSHNWGGIPCFSVDLQGPDWVIEESSAARARWSRGELVMSIYFSDNRTQRFAASGMSDEEILRAFLAYELEFIRPQFDFQLTKPPKFARVAESHWMQWGWTATGGKRRGTEARASADQRHVIFSLWLNPWVMSFDWASTNMDAIEGPTLEMIEALESLQFHPDCFTALMPEVRH
jgi:hypothetical protein